MRTIDALAASAGLLACLTMGRAYANRPEDVAAESWLMEQALTRAFVRFSEPFAACYAITMPPETASAAERRAGILLTAGCYGSVTGLAVD